MIRILLLLAVLLLISSCSDSKVEDFCGISTNGPCTMDVQCQLDGCSYEVCRSTLENSVVTTCEYKECYDAEANSKKCGCVKGGCQWN